MNVKTISDQVLQVLPSIINHGKDWGMSNSCKRILVLLKLMSHECREELKLRRLNFVDIRKGFKKDHRIFSPSVNLSECSNNEILLLSAVASSVEDLSGLGFEVRPIVNSISDESNRITNERKLRSFFLFDLLDEHLYNE
jgi:hypothetical protein